jgi:hypothetical protein
VSRGSVLLLEVCGDALGVGDGELFEGFLPVRDSLTFDEDAFGFAFGVSS